MIIGIPKEILEREHRVAALPEEVGGYRQLGFEVLVEAGAGEGAQRSDAEYEAAGATIASVADVWQRADVILKVKQPHFNAALGANEADLVREGATLITFLHPAAPANHEIIRTLARRNVTSLTMDGIPRIPRALPMDALSSMSVVTGYKSVILAAAALPRFIPAVETPMGITTEPAEVLIVGVGVVGMEALATAKGLGARVKVFDIREGSRNRAAALGAEIVGFEMPQDLVLDEVGSAEALPADWLDREREALRPIITSADVVVLSVLVPGEVAPVLVTEDMVASMKPGSVIVDVSIDQGGNCAVTVPATEVVSHGVTVMGYINIPGSVPVHSSMLYAKNMSEFVKNLFKNGPEEPDFADEIVAHTLVTRGGEVVHAGALHAMANQ